MAQGSKLVVVAALVGNLAIATTKFAAAAVTGSSAMLSEAVHSLVDTGNEMLLLYGLNRAARPPDAARPFGHGRELYFWAFVVALLIFAGGALAAIYQGISHIRDPEPIRRPGIVFAVLAASFVFEGISWAIARREFRKTQGSLGWWQAFRQSKDPTTFMVLFEDTAALAGIIVAAAGVCLALLTGDPRWDGIASLAIGAILAVVAVLLGRESKELLLGERADPELSKAIGIMAARTKGVYNANAITTVQLAPEQVIAYLSLEFDDELRTPDIEAAVARLEKRVRAAHPQVAAVFIKPQTAKSAAHRLEDNLAGVTADGHQGSAPSQRAPVS